MTRGDFDDALFLKTIGVLEQSKRYYREPEHGPRDESQRRSVIDEMDKKKKDLLSFREQCVECTDKWQNEVRKRLEQAFGRNTIRLDASKCQPLSPTFRHSIDKKTKSDSLLKMLAVSIPDYGYDARMAFIMDEVRFRTGLTNEEYIKFVEIDLAKQLKQGYMSEQQNLEAQSTTKSRLKKKMLVGLGVVGGALALGITAGLAAPVVLPVFASMLGAAYLTGATATTLFIVVFGAGGAGLAGYKVEKRYQDIDDFSFVPIAQNGSMRVAIGVSGWIKEEEDVKTPWRGLSQPGLDAFVLRCETEAFKELGNSLRSFVKSTAVTYAAVGTAKAVGFAAAMAALALPVTVIQFGQLIDNQKSGLILADALRKRSHGHRPVTLAGYSLGALTIVTCLKELAKDPEANLGIVQNVMLMGLPSKVTPLENWSKMRMLVAGRFIHCYSRNDWVLRYVFRSTALEIGQVAGLSPIEGVEGLENVDLTGVIDGHLEYSEKIPEMLNTFNLF